MGDINRPPYGDVDRVDGAILRRVLGVVPSQTDENMRSVRECVADLLELYKLPSDAIPRAITAILDTVGAWRSAAYPKLLGTIVQYGDMEKSEKPRHDLTRHTLPRLIYLLAEIVRQTELTANVSEIGRQEQNILIFLSRYVRALSEVGHAIPAARVSGFQGRIDEIVTAIYTFVMFVRREHSRISGESE